MQECLKHLLRCKKRHWAAQKYAASGNGNGKEPKLQCAELPNDAKFPPRSPNIRPAYIKALCIHGHSCNARFTPFITPFHVFSLCYFVLQCWTTCFTSFYLKSGAFLFLELILRLAELVACSIFHSNMWNVMQHSWLVPSPVCLLFAMQMFESEKVCRRM